MSHIINQYYTKSIRLTPNGFSLFKLDSAGRFHREDHANEENVLLSQRATSFFDFQPEEESAVEVVVATHVPMLVPDIIFEESKIKDYLAIQFDIAQLVQAFADSMGLYRSICFLTRNECDILSTLPFKIVFKSEAAILYDFLLHQEAAEAVLLSVNSHFVDFFVMHANAPALVNRSFRTENVDVLYYSLNCVQQFGMAEPTFYVHYFSQPNKKLNTLLRQYHNKVEVL